MAEAAASKQKATDNPAVARFRADGTLPAQISSSFLAQLTAKELRALKKQFGAAPDGEGREQKSRREKRLKRVETALEAHAAK